MKRLLLMAVALLITALSACSNSNNSLETLAKKGVLTAVTSAGFAPFSYMDGKTIVGLDMDILAEIAKDLDATAQAESINFKMIFQTVSAGKADIGIGAITITEERKQTVDFSIPYFTAGQAAIIPVGSDIKNATDLADRRIAVPAGTECSKFAHKTYPNAKITEYYDFAPAYEALKKGLSDVVIIDNTIAEAAVQNDEGYIVLNELLTEEKYGICVKKGNSELLAAINKTLQRLLDEGRIDEFYIKHTEKE